MPKTRIAEGAEIHVFSQQQLEAALSDEPREEIKPDSDVSLKNAFGDGDLVVLLIDRSGSATGVSPQYTNYATRIAEDALAAGKRVAVYGFSGGGYVPAADGAPVSSPHDMDPLLFEYKAADSTSLAGLRAIPYYGHGGTPTNEALEEIAKRHDPSQGATVLVLTDGVAYEPDFDNPRGPGLVEDLRQAGFSLLAVVDSYSAGGYQRVTGEQFEPDYVLVDPYDLDGMLVATGQGLSQLGVPRAERDGDYRVRIEPDYSGYTHEQLGLGDHGGKVRYASGSNVDIAQRANGTYTVVDHDGNEVRALYRDGRWFHEPEKRPFDGKPIFPVEVEDPRVLEALTEARAPYVTQPELSDALPPARHERDEPSHSL